MSDGPSKEEKMDYDLDELERLEKGATKGPWIGANHDPDICTCNHAVMQARDPGGWTKQSIKNAAFIATARNALPAMIRDLRRYRGALVWLSCLGNGELPGNSVGNMIAREALKEPS